MAFCQQHSLDDLTKFWFDNVQSTDVTLDTDRHAKLRLRAPLALGNQKYRNLLVLFSSSYGIMSHVLAHDPPFFQLWRLSLNFSSKQSLNTFYQANGIYIQSNSPYYLAFMTDS